MIASIVALTLLDRARADGSRAAAALRGGWTWLTDAGVIGRPAAWHVVGALSSDDGYNLTIARVVRRGRLRRQLLPILRRH